MSASKTGEGNGVSAPNASNHADHAIEFEFHSPDFSPPEAELRYAQEKLETRLKKYGRHVLGVRVHVRDVNGPKGGVGMTCHLEARLAGMEPVNVEEQEQDLRAAIDVAIDRLGVVVGRHVDRARERPLDRGRKIAQGSKLAD
ncbi:MAG TPA: HPF/RaiA family ribosome-associated protein [Polyangia bacterium]